MSPAREEPVMFACGGVPLIGILHRGGQRLDIGVVIVVGGPQYRAGSHRQFLLLARALAQAGYSTLRFDYRGMGDSGGDSPGFEHIDDDIAAAADVLTKRCPEIKRIVLWGLCDAASAILFYAAKDPRVAGIALLNPWVRTAETEARAQLKHYYTGRLASRAFWSKALVGGLDLRGSLSAFAGAIKRAGSGGGGGADRASLPARMAAGLAHFGGKVLLIMSGQDLTAREFDDVAQAAEWKRLLSASRVARRDLPDADHTFSRRAWRDQVAAWTIEWLQLLRPPSR